MRTYFSSGALRIAAIYAIAAGLWILLSDKILFALVTNHETASTLSMYKGWVFVAVTTWLLYWERKNSEGTLQGVKPVQPAESENRLHFLIAILLPFLALGSQWLFWPYINPFVWFLFFPAAFFSARIGGFRAGLISTVLSAALVWYFFIPPQFSWEMDNPYALFSVMVFVLMGYLFSDIQERLRAANRLATIALGESEERFDLILRTNPNAMLIVAKSGQIERVNDQAEKTFGYEAGTLTGVHIGELVSDRLKNIHETIRLDLPFDPHKHSPASQQNLQGRRRDGGIFPAEISLGLMEIKGKPYVIATVVDITERRQAEVAREKILEQFEALIANLHMGVLVESAGRQILQSNQSFCDLFGIPAPEALLGENCNAAAQNASALFSDPLRFMARIRNILAGGKTVINEELELADGRVFERDYVPIRLRGEFIGNMWLYRDITERKHAGEALRRRESILEAVGFAAEQFLSQADPEQAIPDALARLGDASKSSRVYIFQNRVEPDGRILTSQRYEWCGQGIEPQMDNPALQDFNLMENGFGRWVETLGKGQIIHGNVREFPPGEQAALSPQGIFSIAVIPILVRQSWWGFIGYDACDREREWHSAEIEALQAAANILGAAIERKQAGEALRESEEKYRILIEQIPAIVYIDDAMAEPGRTVYVSPQVEHILGVAQKDWQAGLLDFWSDHIHPEDRERALKAYMDFFRNGEPMDVEYRMAAADGKVIWFRDQAILQRDENGAPRLVHGVMHNINERKQAEEEIRRLNEELEQRVVERTAQLSAANRELEAFTYSVSHDLRAPLRAIDGYTRILMEDYESALDAEGRQVCGVIRGETQRMGRLIDNLLNLSRLSRAELQAVPIDMASMALSVFEDLMKDRNREQVDFTVGEMPPIQGDPALMRQVWINLLNNAIKFTSKKERPVIETGGYRSEGESVFFVRDNGAGFDMQYENRLFGVFQRLHSDAEFEGTGVGLAIVQRVIHRHGGRVWAKGKMGEGATFYFALPC